MSTEGDIPVQTGRGVSWALRVKFHSPNGLLPRVAPPDITDKASYWRRGTEEKLMIASEAALYGSTNASGSGVTTLLVCSCGQEIGATKRLHCPRCGCCLN